MRLTLRPPRRNRLLGIDAAATKVEALFGEALANDVQEAIRRHLADPNLHGRDAA